MTTNTNSAHERTASIDLAQLDRLEALDRAAMRANDGAAEGGSQK